MERFSRGRVASEYLTSCFYITRVELYFVGSAMFERSRLGVSEGETLSRVTSEQSHVGDRTEETA